VFDLDLPPGSIVQHGIASGGTVSPILNTLGKAPKGGKYVEHGVFARRNPDAESGHAVTTTAADTHQFLSGDDLDENCYAAIKAFGEHGGKVDENYQVHASRQLPLSNPQRVQEARKQKRAAEERARFG